MIQISPPFTDEEMSELCEEYGLNPEAFERIAVMTERDAPEQPQP